MSEFRNKSNPRPLTPETEYMARLHLSGNITPTSWYSKILMPSPKRSPGVSSRIANGKPDLEAITILSEICWWYRPREVRDEHNNHVCWERKFKEDVLQISPKQLSKKFGFSVKQCQRALARLAALGLIRRELRTVTTSGGNLGNVPFVRLIPPAVEKITWQYDGKDLQPDTYPPVDKDVQRNGHGCPDITKKTNRSAKTPKSPSRGLDSFSGVKKERNPVSSFKNREWEKDANADPMAKEFLSLLEKSDFIQEGEHVARSFVKRRQSGKLHDADIRLVAAMRDCLPLPRTLDGILGKLDKLAALARELAEAEVENLSVELEPDAETIVGKQSVLQAAARFVLSNPDADWVFESGTIGSHPLWALMIEYQRNGNCNIERWKTRFNAELIAELTTDAAVLPFLTRNQFEINELLGLSLSEIETIRAEHITTLNRKRADLVALLQWQL